MDFSWQKILFFLSFFVVVLSSFLFSETIYGYFVLLSLSVVIFWGTKLFKFRKKVNTSVLLTVAGFLLFSFTSLLFSISFPLSLFTFIRYVSLFSVFLFFSSISFEDSEKKFFLDIFIVLGVFLSVASFVIFLNKDLGESIPGLNLIYPTYGHNHLGTFLLLMAPVSSYLYFSKKKNIYLLSMVIFYLSLLISFGRVMLFLAIIQLLVLLFVFLKKNKIKKLNISRVVLSGVLYLSVLFLFSQLLLPSLSNCEFLEDSVIREKVCKYDFGTNVRHYYWSQSIISFFEKPIFGSGVGTFELTSYKYRQIPELWVKHTHNDFLQIFSESGVFAGSFFVLIIFYIFRNIDRGGGKHSRLIYLSLGSFVVDIMFDYNFHLFALALSFLTLGGLLSRESVGGFSDKLMKKVIYALLFVVSLVALLNIAISLTIFADKERLAFKAFPYFRNHSKIFINSQELSIEEKQDFIQIYLPLMADHIIDELPVKEGFDFDRSLWEKDPWRSISSFAPNYYYLEQDIQNLKDSMSFVSNFLAERKEYAGFEKESIEFRNKNSWTSALIFLAKHDLENNNVELSANHIVNAYNLENWSLNKDMSFIRLLLDDDYSYEQTESFLKILEEIPLEYWGENREALSEIYYAVFTKNFDLHKDPSRRVFVFRRMIDLVNWSSAWMEGEFFDKQDFENIKLGETYDENWDLISLFQVAYQVSSIEYSDNEYFNEGFYQDRVIYLEKALQNYFDILLNSEDEEQINKYIEFVNKNSFGLYWMPAQKGYFLAKIGWMDKAEESFSNCLSLNEANHECQHGLNSLKENRFDYGRYDEIREIISDF